MMRIEDYYRKSGLTQAEVAKCLGLAHPWLSALLKGKISLFSLDALVNMATRAGMRVRGAGEESSLTRRCPGDRS